MASDIDLTNDTANLIFIKGQMFYRRTTGEKTHTKTISPAQLKAAVDKLDLDTGWIDPNVRLLRWKLDGKDEITMVYSPPHQDLLRLIDEEGHLQSYSVPLPGLVFAAKHESYAVWAVKEPPLPGTMLYHAPFPNIYQDGDVCWGDNPHEKPGPAYAQRSLLMFLHSPFSAHNAADVVSNFRLDVRVMWAALGGARPEVKVPGFDGAGFPLEELMPTGWTMDYGYKRFVTPVGTPTRTVIAGGANMRPPNMT